MTLKQEVHHVHILDEGCIKLSGFIQAAKAVNQVPPKWGYVVNRINVEGVQQTVNSILVEELDKPLRPPGFEKSIFNP